MNQPYLLTQTDQFGEVWQLGHFNNENKGWYGYKNNYDAVFIPYSRSFKINDITYMATTKEEALRLAIILIKSNDEAFAQFEKNHPELNP